MLALLALAVAWSPKAAARTQVEEVLQELFVSEAVYPQDEAELQLSNSVQYERADRRDQLSLVPRSEYGITDWVQVELEMPLLATRQAGLGAAQGLGNVELGLMANPVNSRRAGFALSFGVEATLPTASETVDDATSGLGAFVVFYGVLGPLHANTYLALEGERSAESDSEPELEPYAALGLFAPVGTVVPSLEVAIGQADEALMVTLAAGLTVRVHPDVEVGAAALIDARSPRVRGGVLQATLEFGGAEPEDD